MTQPGASEVRGAGGQSLLRVATTLLRFRRLVFVLPAVAVVTAGLVTVRLPRNFTAVASFVPQSQTPSRLSALAGLSAQLGLGNLPQASAFGTPDFYRELLRTNEILGALVDARYSVPWRAGQFEGTLADFWRTQGPTAEYRRDLAIRRLRTKVNATVDPRTQMVKLSVTTHSPDLSTRVVERALALLSQFNQEQRQSQSGQERKFLGERLADRRPRLAITAVFFAAVGCGDDDGMTTPMPDCATRALTGACGMAASSTARGCARSSRRAISTRPRACK